LAWQRDLPDCHYPALFGVIIISVVIVAGKAKELKNLLVAFAFEQKKCKSLING
jgi:hypothetical protein